MTSLNKYLKTAEAARILGMSQNTLRAWAEAGKIPVRRNPANRYRLFLRRDLEKFLARIA
jgi:excisionase family DNA binding protein